MRMKIGNYTVSVSDAVLKNYKTKESFVKDMVKQHPHIKDDNLAAYFGTLYETVTPKKGKKDEGVGE